MTRIGSLACSAVVFFGRAKVKSPYFTSVARNGHLTNKPEAESALILRPPPPPRFIFSNSAARFNGYLKLLKATRKGKKSKGGFEVTIEPGISRRKGCALTNCAKPSFFLLAKAPCCYFYSPPTSSVLNQRWRLQQ